VPLHLRLRGVCAVTLRSDVSRSSHVSRGVFQRWSWSLDSHWAPAGLHVVPCACVFSRVSEGATSLWRVEEGALGAEGGLGQGRG